MNWTDPAAIGYPALFGGVLLGSIVPVVPTGAVVGAAAAVATTTGHLSLPLVIVLATLGAYLGDVVTFGIPRLGSEAAFRWISRRQPAGRLEKAREQFARRGWQLVVIGRLVPAGRIPVLLAAAALGYPWRRLLPAAFGACVLWATAYTLLGILSGGLFDSPLVATLLATVLVLPATAVAGLIPRWRRRGNPGYGGSFVKLTVYGASWCPDVKRSRALLDRAGVKYSYVDVEADEDAERRVRELQDGARRIPTIVWEDGSFLVEPSDDELSARL
ncbi:VTT domain-containing protein [Streptomyces sp. MN03-5084-2B]|nr:VTT domain-containing protein [Streptomyces sp. MN03-5084-2B]